MIKLLRIVGLLEGVSYLVLLLIAMPLKHMAGKPEAVWWVGSAHGGLFVAFVLLLLTVAALHRKGPRWIVEGLIASVVPLGTLVFDLYRLALLDERTAESA